MPLCPPHPRQARVYRGFTLVELLTVMSIVAILVGILVPAVGVVQRKVNESKSHVLFQSVITSFDAYKSEYGRYPIFFKDLQASPNPWATDHNEIDYTFMLNDGNAILRRVLTADSAYLVSVSAPGSINYNKLAIRFLNLTDDNIDARVYGTPDNPFIVDGFKNPQIGMVVHSGSHQEINKDAFTSAKAVGYPDDTGVSMQPKVNRNLPQVIAMYSLIQPINGDPVNSLWCTNWPYIEYSNDNN